MTRTTWNLGLLYKSDNDPQIEKDLIALEKACKAFEKKYRGKDFVSTSTKLKQALDDAAKRDSLNGGKPCRYFSLKMSIDTGDTALSAHMAKYEERITKAMNGTAFFYLDIAKIPKADQKKYLKDPILREYAYMLKKVFEHAKHNLSEKEEQLMDLLSQPSYSMWVDGADKLLNEQVIPFGKEKLPLPKAIMGLPTMKSADREEIWGKVIKTLKSISHFAEGEMNAIYTYKKISDERRGYAKPYSATVLGYEQDEKIVEGLVDLVSKYFSLSHRFYKVHAKLLGKKKITQADRGASIGKIDKKFDFQSSIEIVRKEFEKVDPKYAKFLDTFLENGQFDVYPKKGKTGGAFCAGGRDDEPTYIMLNHTDDIRSVETLAHEMGHAIHTELSKSQPLRYQRYSMAVAETASTFFEQVASDALEKQLTEKEKVIFLHNKIMGDIATVFRQIALFNFENELHLKVRKEGMVSKADIAKLLSKHMRTYLGNAVETTDDDGYFFVYWSHIRRFFYVYSYAYGQLVSRALFENWKKDPSYATKIEKFLSLGRSMSPEDIFRSIGINTRDPKFFEAGLKGIEADIAKLEKLAKKH